MMKQKQKQKQIELNSKQFLLGDIQKSLKQTEIYNQLLCSQGNQVNTVCINKKCQKTAFVCENQKCHCHLQHQYCIKSDIRVIEKVILKNSFSLQPLCQRVQEQFDKAITQLSNIRENIIKGIKQKYQLIGLSKEEKSFLDAIKFGSNKGIDCKFVWELYNKSTDEDFSGKITLDIIFKNFQEICDSLNKEIASYDSKFNSFFQSLNQTQVNLFFNSRVIKDVNDAGTIDNFFNNKIKSATLLYRASQNNFQVAKFYQNCQNIPQTMIICQTQFNKVIGGYTPLQWLKVSQNQHFKDQSGESFLFSLTNKNKFALKTKQNAIYRHSNNEYGPGFGNGCDLIICDRGNKSKHSYANVGSTYHNYNYKANHQDSFQKFSGSKIQYNFHIKQWQVWRIQFNQK